ncbi:hypothetical protein DFH09DRAFT_1354625 [Mycena vulgaris]|nr:hypothetical protein DFH09DRAFT_1354625 [Mycena vulgaris]
MLTIMFLSSFLLLSFANVYPLLLDVIMRCLPPPLLLSCIIPLSASLILTTSSLLHFVAFPHHPAPTRTALPDPTSRERLSTRMGALSQGAPRIDGLAPTSHVSPVAYSAPARHIERPLLSPVLSLGLLLSRDLDGLTTNAHKEA